MKRLFFLKSHTDLPEDIKFLGSGCVSINLDNFGLKRDFDKTLFEKDYLDFISSLGKNNNSLYWWASALSEKNPFTSKLFIRLYKLVLLDKEIKHLRDRDIAIICSDVALSRQITFNYKKDFRASGFYFNLLDDLFSMTHGVLNQLKKALSEYRDLLFARRFLSARRDFIQRRDKYTIFRTWSDQRSYKSGSYEDSYFKDLLRFFSEQGKKVLIFTGVISDYKTMIERLKEDRDNLIIPVNFYLKGIDILRCLFCSCLKRPSVKDKMVFYNIDVRFLVAEELKYDVLTTHFFDSLLQYYCCVRLARSVKIEKFIYTFENYAWEKMSILGLRHGDRNIKIIGFQHAFVSKNSFKYFPRSSEKDRAPLPDRIVTMGTRTLDIMNRFGSYPDRIFSVGCALRQGYLSKTRPVPRNDNGGIFVAFTITVDDTLKTLRFLFASGLGTHNEKVYLRFHPATNREYVLKNIGFTLPTNFIISENPPIKKEIERSSVVLYTWTTVCLEALKMGRPVIYLDVNYPLEVDPLFELKNGLKDSCNNPADLIEKIDRIRSIDKKIFDDELDKAQEYLNDYFMPVNETNIKAFFN